MRPVKSSLLPVALLCLCVSAQAAEKTLRFHGYAYDLASNRYLYTELHEQKAEGDRWLGGSISYIAPDGSLIGKKSLDFSQDPFIPVFRLELKPGSGYIEGISAIGKDSIEMYKKGYKDARESGKKVARPDNTTADSGFHNLMRAWFPDLMENKKVVFHFAVAGELDTFKFRGQRIDDATFEGKPAVRFRVQPDTLLRLLVDPLELTYDPTNRRLLEYRGVSNLHDPASGEAYVVRISYASRPPEDAPILPAEYQ